jgi:predicted dehydrogenase
MPKPSRREFLKWSGKAAAGSALAGAAVPFVHAAEDNTIRLALIGCGGRGSGAVANALASPNGPCKLVAMADLFEKRAGYAHKALAGKFPGMVDVPPERRFLGFDAYRKAIDCLRPGIDVALACTYPAFRVCHLEYAVKRGVHCFMEKSFATDPCGVRRIIAAGQEAQKKNLKIASGLMCRHSVNRQELLKRIQDGQLGPIQLLRTYRIEAAGPMPQRPAGLTELLWQVRNWFSFYWLSGGRWAETSIHQIDEMCWFKDAYPVSAHGICGRAANNKDPGQGLDSFSIEYTFADGAKAYNMASYVPNCDPEFATYIAGTIKSAQLSKRIHLANSRIYRDHRMQNDNIEWQAPKEQGSCWQIEWDVLLNAIRKDLPLNEADRSARSNLVDIMGRAAMHMGRVVTWDEAFKSNFRWCPDIDAITYDSPPPVMVDAAGQYPVPVPGQWSEL